jgi:nucleoside phosphorylase
MFVCAGESEQFDFAEPIGIGMLDAAINLMRVCLTRKPDSLVFVGTAGSYGDYEIFEIIESATATNIEIGFFDERSYTPIKNRVDDMSDVSRETVVNSSNYITTDKKASAQYLDHGIGLENMEFYAVLKVAKALKIPAKGIFIVTNYCYPDAHEIFIANHREAKERLTNYTREFYHA